MRPKILVLSAISLFLAFSCSVEQSELTLETLTGTAVISGDVTYNAGAVMSDGGIKDRNILPAANQVVIVKVSNASILNDPNVAGYQIFTDSTDANGHYEMEIPVTNSLPVDAEISVAPFRAAWSYDLNGAVVNVNDVLYGTGSVRTAVLENMGIVEENIVLSASCVPDMQLTESHTISGTVYLPLWEAGQYEQWQPAETVAENIFGIQVELLVCKQVNQELYLMYSIEYNVETSNGEYTSTVALPSDVWENIGTNDGSYTVLVSVRTKPLAVNDFRNRFKYTDGSWDSQIVSILYPQLENAFALTVNDQVLESIVNFNFFSESVLLTDYSEVYGIGLFVKNGKLVTENNPFNW